MAEDVGAEDMAEGRLLLLCCAIAGFRGWELGFCGDAQTAFIESWVCNAVDKIDCGQPEGLSPVDANVVGDAGVEDEGVEFGYGSEQSSGDIMDGEEDGEVDLFGLERDSFSGVRCVAVEVFS